MSHQPLLRSSDALKNYTVTSLQVVAYLKAYKEEKPNKESSSRDKSHRHSASAIPELCIFPLSFLYKTSTVYYRHSGHSATLTDTIDNLIPTERLRESRVERLTVKKAGEMRSITVSVENELILQTGSGTFQP